MGKDYRRRIMKQHPFDHLPRMDAGTINGAKEQLFVAYQAMLVIQVQAGKYFAGITPELGFQKPPCGRRVRHGVAAIKAGLQIALRELQGRTQLSTLGNAQTSGRQ